MKVNVSIVIEGEDVEFEVEGSYTQGHPGTMYRSNGDPGDPPDPAEFAIESIKPEMDLTQTQEEDLYEACLEAAQEQDEEDRNEALIDYDDDRD